MDVYAIIKDAPDYVLLRQSKEFPIVKRGQDIDLLVKSVPEWLDYLITMLRKYPGSNLNYPLSNTHHQLDYYEGGFHHKWDLYSELINPWFTNDIWKSKQITNGIITPSLKMDRLSKCYENIQHGKTKYSDYVRYYPDLKVYL